MEVTVGRNPSRVLLIHPCTGALLGESAPRLRHFFETVTGLHRWFGLAAAHRQTARAVKGAFTLSLVFMVVSGFVLWWPRRWNAPSLRQAALYQPRFRGRARWWNWHTVTGFWIALPLLTITLTGVVMAYPWASNLLYRITGSPLPEQSAAPRAQNSEEARRERPHDGSKSGGQKGGAQRHERRDETASSINWDNFFAAAEQQVPGWRTASVRMQDVSGPSLTISVDRGDGGRPDLRSQVILERATGRVLRIENFSTYNEGRRLRMWARFVHTGEAGGILGETIAALTAWGAVALILTGFVLAILRFLKRKASGHEKSRKHRRPAKEIQTV
jgi:uncharacterized iron-regulated membrane protein